MKDSKVLQRQFYNFSWLKACNHVYLYSPYIRLQFENYGYTVGHFIISILFCSWPLTTSVIQITPSDALNSSGTDLPAEYTKCYYLYTEIDTLNKITIDQLQRGPIFCRFKGICTCIVLDNKWPQGALSGVNRRVWWCGGVWECAEKCQVRDCVWCFMPKMSLTAVSK